MDFDEDLLDDGREDGRSSSRNKDKERKKDEEPSRFDDEDFIREQMKDPRIILYEELFKEKLSDEDVEVDLNMILGPYLIKHPEGLLPDEVAEIRAKEKKVSDLINKTKEKYPPGTMVSFVSSKKKRKIHKGDMGTVIEVDDGGRIHVEWDDGSVIPLSETTDTLKIIYTPEKEDEKEPPTTAVATTASTVVTEEEKDVDEEYPNIEEPEIPDEIEEGVYDIEEEIEEEIREEYNPEALTEEEMAEMNAELDDIYGNV